MAKDLAIVLNSGSLNSAVLTALAAQKHRIILVHAEMTEQAGTRQRAAYDAQVAHFKPYREHLLPMPFLSLLKPADPSDMRGAAPQLGQMLELLPLIASAVRLAVHYQAMSIFWGLRIGSNADELAAVTEYGQVWNELIQLPCGQTSMEITMPLLELEPWQVVDLGGQVAAPFEKSWSCLEDGAEPCWACKGCRTRELAFQQAARPDPMRGAKKTG